MSTTNEPLPSHRERAEENLDKAVAELNRLVPGPAVPFDMVKANCARGQAIATVGILQALLHIGDVLSAARPDG